MKVKLSKIREIISEEIGQIYTSNQFEPDDAFILVEPDVEKIIKKYKKYYYDHPNLKQLQKFEDDNLPEKYGISLDQLWRLQVDKGYDELYNDFVYIFGKLKEKLNKGYFLEEIENSEEKFRQNSGKMK